MLTDQATGQQTIQMRFSADVMSERDCLEARNVFRAAGGWGLATTEPTQQQREPRREDQSLNK